jgi:hypothetical protein
MSKMSESRFSRVPGRTKLAAGGGALGAAVLVAACSSTASVTSFTASNSPAAPGAPALSAPVSSVGGGWS